MNWRIVVAVIVMFLVGGVIGGVAERERVQRDRNHETAAGTTTTTAAASDWFGSQLASACPVLHRWATAIGALTFAAQGKGAWTTTRADMLRQKSAIIDTYRDLLPFADSAGKAELEFLISYDTEINGTLERAPSAAAFSKSTSVLASNRQEGSVGVIGRAANTCSQR